MLVIKVISIMKSIIRILIYKILYMSKLKNINIFKCFIGDGSKIIINDKNSIVTIGNKFICRDYVRIKCTKGCLTIGNNVFFNNGCSINCRKNISIGDNSIFGENVKIYDHDHIFKSIDLTRNSGFIEKEVIIGKNVWIGSNSIILKGVRIGDNSVIGSGSIVTKDVREGTIMYNEIKEKSMTINKI